MSQPNDYLPPALTTAAATAALALTLSLPLLQMDAVSRHLLNPARLRTKRRRHQLYETDKTVEIQRLRGRAVVQQAADSAAAAAAAAAGVGSTKVSSAAAKMDGSTWRYNPKSDRLATELLTTRTDYDELVTQITNKTAASPYVVTIGRDEETEETAGLDKREIYLWLAFPPSTTSPSSSSSTTDKGNIKREWRRVQVPLVPFLTALSDAFDDQITSTALCFVSDASSGLAADVLHSVLDEDGGAGVAVVKEPSWMVTVGRIAQGNLVRRENLVRAVFGLCRLEAWRVRDHVGSSRTVVFTLPGQSTTPTLLPLICQAFPHERHVFAYDTCFESVARGLMLRKTSVKLSRLMLPSIGGGGGGGGEDDGIAGGDSDSESDDGAAAIQMVEAALQMPQWVTSSSPITQLKSLRKYDEALADLPFDQAGIVEAWMASIDAFLQLKAEERTNNYTPFVCRMGFLMGRTGLGNLAADRVEELNELALVNLLQYVTGSRSRPLKEEVVIAAKKALADAKAIAVADAESYQLKYDDRKLLEACCFLHHGILIGDKTLMDTVQPKKEWSLKAARKLQSCACCDPEEDEEGSDTGDMDVDKTESRDGGVGKIDMTVPGAFAMGLNKRPNADTTGASAPKQKKTTTRYVDGKTQFAFDPTKF